tara:strand:- start:90 stop:398 length:309 start_codon:yes stop_codon:yes gene_type:complete
MIDTNKYEGHYKGPWANQYGDVVKLVYPNESSPSLDADQRLIIDAPLFFQEVKRLRARIEQAIATLRSQPNDLEDGPDYHRDLLSFLDGAVCHAIDILEGKE